MYGKKCKMSGTPDLKGQVSVTGYPTVAATNKPSVDGGMLTKAQTTGGGYDTVASNSGTMMDNTFSKISSDVSYSKTPKRS